MRYVILISLGIVMSFILLFVGHFLFSLNRDQMQKDHNASLPGTQAGQTIPATTAKAGANAVRYIHRSDEINGLKQEINILEIDPGVPGIRIQPVLSHDLIYGFEILSEMAARKNAYAAVTGGFFSKYGLPSGMVVIDGELVSASTGRYPVFAVANGRAELKEFKSAITIRYNRKSTDIDSTTGSSMASSAGITSDNGSMAGSISGSITADCINAAASPKTIAVYMPYYGQTNRADKLNVTATIASGVVTKVAFYENEAEIPKDGMLISFFNMKQYSVENLPLQVGDSVTLVHQPELDPGTDAYECGSWLVRGGKAVVLLKDAWIGVLTNRDPRTAIGIKENGTVILMTVDGRQPGYSAGFTGQELAEYLIGCGVKDAAMLDGGASAEMILQGKLVSKPSYKGEERTLGGGILVLTGEYP